MYNHTRFEIMLERARIDKSFIYSRWKKAFKIKMHYSHKLDYVKDKMRKF